VIVQDGRFDSTRSVTICGFTSTEIEAPLFRVAIAPNPENRLQGASWLMADKLFTVPREKLGRRIGRLAEDDVSRLNRAIMIFLGLGGG